MAVTSRGENGVGVLVKVQGVGRRRDAEGGQVRRGEDHERRHSLRGRRHVRGGDELTQHTTQLIAEEGFQRNRPTDRPTAVRSSQRWARVSWPMSKSPSAGWLAAGCSLALSLFLDDRAAIE